MKQFGKRGFTLIEVVVVMVILAILAAVFVPSYTSYIEKAKENKYLAEVRFVSTGVESYILEEYAAGNLNSRSIRNLISYELDDPKHPLADLLSGECTPGATIDYVGVKLGTGEYLGIIYRVNGYVMEFTKETGVIKIEKTKE